MDLNKILKGRIFEVISIILLVLFIFTNTSSPTSLAIYEFTNTNLTINPILEQEINLSIPINEEIEEVIEEEVIIEESVERPKPKFYEYTPVYRTESLVQSQAVLGTPVTWTKYVYLPEETNNLEVEIHGEAFNIKTEKIDNPAQLSITGSVVIDTQVNKFFNWITGSSVYNFVNKDTTFEVSPVVEEDLTINPIEDTPENNLTINPIKDTPKQVKQTDSSENKTVIITQPVKNVKITYQTPAPISFEKVLSTDSKEVIISSNIHYKDILSFTSISESTSSSISLLNIKGNNSIEFSITKYIDSNNNGLIDKIEWITPYLSNETFIVNYNSYGTPFTITAAPTHSTPTINTTIELSNATSVNLTVYNNTAADAENDRLKHIWNWWVNRSGGFESLAVLNMPFEVNGSESENTKDYSGRLTHGVITGATFDATGGHDGFGAYTFDGVNDKIVINNEEQFDFSKSDPMSISVWIKTASSGGVLVEKFDSNIDGWSLGVTGSKIRFQWLSDSATKGFRIDNTKAVDDDQWHHIVATKSSGTGFAVLDIYMDGSIEPETSQTDATPFGTMTHNTAVQLGLRISDGADYTGTIDDVIIFNRSLNATQVLEIYQGRNRTGWDIITSNETILGEYWKANLTLNDGTSDSTTLTTAELYINRSTPTHSNPIINTTIALSNTTSDNLTVYNNSVLDQDGDRLKHIWNWWVNHTTEFESIAVLNLPFEVNGSESENTKDYSGRLNHGLLSGSTFWNATGGRDGFGAYEFDGVNDHIDMGTDSSLTGFTSFTASAWAKSSDSSITPQAIFAKDDSTNREWSLYLSHSGVTNSGARFQGFVGGNFFVSDHEIDMRDGQWHLITGVYNGSFNIYVDGVLRNVATADIGTIDDDGATLFIGSKTDGVQELKGTIDEVLILNRSLNATQVFEIYQGYTNRTGWDIITSEETRDGEYWKASLTLNDGTEDSSTLNTSELLIESGEDEINPTFSNAVNETGIPKHQNITLNITLDDETALANYSIEWNDTGSFANITTFQIPDSAKTWDANTSTNITASKDEVISWRYYSCDTTNNCAVSTTYNFTVNNTPIIHLDPIINSTANNTELSGLDGLNTTDSNLTVYNNSASDGADSDRLKHIWNWWVNTSTKFESLAVLNMPFEANGTDKNPTKDYSGRLNHGVVTGATFNLTGGHDGFGAYEFDGVSDHIDMGSGSDLTGFTEFTLSAWAKSSDTSSNTQVIFGKDDVVNREYSLYLSQAITNDGSRFQVVIGGTFYIANHEVDMRDGQWHHFAGVYNGSRLNLYVDGDLKGVSDDTGGGAVDDDGANLLIGSRNADTQELKGTIDEVLIINRSLNSSQVLEIYQGRNRTGWDMITKDETRPGEYWKASLTLNDGTEDSSTLNTSELYIRSTPSHSNPIINSTANNTKLSGLDGLNTTGSNLTVYNNSIVDPDGERIKHIWNWWVNTSTTEFESLAVLNMPFESNGSSDSAVDYSGRLNHGVITGATFLPTGGYDGFGAYDFDGVNDKITIANEEQFDFDTDDPMSASFWIKTTQGDGAIIEKFDSSIDGIGIQTLSGTVRFQWLLNNGGDFRIDSTNTVDDGNWHHVVATKSSGNGFATLDIYIDGSIEAETNQNDNGDTSGSLLNNDPVLLGIRIGDVGDFLGTLDDIIIFNRSLNASQVLELYNGQNTRTGWDTIFSNETRPGEYWKASLTLNDGTEDSVTLNTSELYIRSTPSHSNPTINSTANNTELSGLDGLNTTDSNLTVYNNSVVDPDGERIKHIWNWWVNTSTTGFESLAVLNMPFEANGTSDSAIDYSGRENHGVVTGASFNLTGGHDGFGAFEFDGSEDDITIANEEQFDFTQNDPMSVSLWVKMTTSDVDALVNKADSDLDGWDLISRGTNGLRWQWLEQGSADGYFVDSPDSYRDDQWHHIVATSGSGTTSSSLNLYIDGVDVSTGRTDVGTTTNVLNDASVIIGERTSGGNDLTGTIDDVIIFNRTLSATQVLEIYQGRNRTGEDIIVSEETRPGEYWKASLTLNDGTEDSVTLNTSELYIRSTPSHSSPIINSTANNTGLSGLDGLNTTGSNLTVYNNSIVDPDAERIKHIWNWWVNNSYQFESLTVLNMPFEANGTSDSAIDYSGSENHGVITGATFNLTGGHDGFGAYEFDGSGQYINLGDDDRFDLIGNWTLSSWILVESGTNGERMIIAKGAFGDGYYEYRVSNVDTLQTWVNEFTPQSTTATGTNVDDNQWHHVVTTYNSTHVSIYLDGSLEIATSVTGTITTNTGDLQISGRENNNFDFEGTIDEVTIWNRSLSQAQILEIYQGRNRTGWDIITSEETRAGEYWKASLTLNDGTEDSTTLNTSELYIRSTPSHSNPIINSTANNTELSGLDGLNTTDANLTVYNNSVVDPDGERIKHIWNWWLNNESIAVLNMPFEANGTNTTYTKDYSGSERTGALVRNPVWNASAGYDGFGAYQFNTGTSDAIDFPNFPISTFPFTFSTWVKITHTGPSNTIISLADSSETAEEQVLNVDTGVAKICAREGSTFDCVGNVVVNDGQWHHVVGVFLGDTQRILYVDGALDVERVEGVRDLVDGDRVRIGSLADSTPSNFFTGSIDDILIFDRALNASQILEIYQGANRTGWDIIAWNETNPGEYWKASLTLNDGTEDSVTLNTSELYIRSTPSHSSPIINTTIALSNASTDNLTVYNNSIVDPDPERIKHIWNWWVNNESITLLNLPMEKNGTSDNAIDYSGFNNHGAVSGASENLTGGYDGFTAYNFDGNNDFINIGTSPFNENNANEMSISAWIYTGKDLFDGSIQIFMDTSSSNPPANDGFWLAVDDRAISNPTDGIQLAVATATDTSRDVECSDCIGEIAWYHVVATYDGTNGKIYVNGIDETDEDGVDATGTGDYTPRNSNLYIGTDNVEAFDFNGVIDDVILFNRSLSASQVLEIYQGLNRTGWDIITSDETEGGEYWKASLTLNDGTEDSTTLNTSEMSTGDSTKPTFSSGVNETGIQRHQNITLNITLTDETALANYTIEWNDTGPFTNITTFQISDSPATWDANTSTNITATQSQNVSWRYYTCDSSNNCAISTTFNFTVNNTGPVFTTVEDQTLSIAKLWYYDVNATDIDSDTLTYTVNDSTIAIDSSTGNLTFTPID